MKQSETRRVEALADGVFAIVLTLLVLELSLPLREERATGAELSRVLLDMWPVYLSYGLTFLILGLFWLHHHNLFTHIKRVDGPSLWLNLLFLMFIALIPFSSSLVATHGDQPVSAIIYGLNWLIPLLLSLVLFSYSTSGSRLTEGDVDPAFVRREKVAGSIVSVIIALAIVLAFVSTIIPLIVYAALAAFYIVTAVLTSEGLSGRRKRDI